MRFAHKGGNGLAKFVDLLENHLALEAGLALWKDLVGEVAAAGSMNSPPLLSPHYTSEVSQAVRIHECIPIAIADVVLAAV